MSAKRVTVHNILLAADARDAAIAIQRDPSLAGASVITRESQLYGLMVDEWHITERAASNMRDLNKMGQHIGDVIRWTHDLGSGRVHAVLTGELRQVYHTAGETVLNVCSAVYDTSGSMEEYGLAPDTRVEILGTDEVAEFRHTS